MKETLDTKQILFRTYKELSLEMPLRNISVKKLCEKANVTRGSFYYYFYSTYDLICQLYHEEVIVPVRRHIETHNTGISELNLSLIYRDKEFYLQAFAPSDEPNLTTFFFQECQENWNMIYRKFAEANPALTPAQIRFLRIAMDYFSDAHAYASLKWIRSGMTEEPSVISAALDLASTKGLNGLAEELLHSSFSV